SNNYANPTYGGSQNDIKIPEEYEKENSKEICLKEVHYIKHQGDLNNLSTQCQIIEGSIIINDFEDPILDFGVINTISGDLKISNVSNLVRVIAPHLNTIKRSFLLYELTSLTSVSFPNLKSVDTINWKILPILSTISFDSGIDYIRNIIISDTSLVGFNLKDNVKELNILNINNNRFLESITTNVKYITEELAISANARNVMAYFPRLQWANNITIRDTMSIDISNIESVNASVGFIENNFQSLKVPKLKNVGGTLSIIENFNLNDAEFPSVVDIGGGLMIVNNTGISKINFFPKLSTIGGAIQFFGNFKDASLNKLKLVKGSAIIKSNSNQFDCTKWVGVEENTSVIRGGRIDCTAGSKNEV
ncbi:uncharacterized protein ASCRUDRAFT_21058, partial [Ascoidea rubescens DSM 1968]